MTVDLTTEIRGVKFKNPIISGASELVCNVDNARRTINAGVGGLLTKTYTMMLEVAARSRPNNFVYRGRGYAESGSFMTVSSNHVEDMDLVIKRDFPEFRRMCSEAGIPFTVAWYGRMDVVNGKLKDGTLDEWIGMARKIEAAGADMQELTLSCPVAKAAVEQNPMAGYEVIKAVSENVSTPVGAKIGPFLEPLEETAKEWARAGAAFITAHNADYGIRIDVESEMPLYAPAMGGYIFGRTFLPFGVGRVARIKKAVDIPVFAVGGVYNAEDALQYMLVGAEVVQVCTAIYLKGPALYGKIIKGIADWMERKGYSNIEEFRGKALPMIMSWGEVKKHEKYPYAVPPNTPYVPIVNEESCNLCGMCESCPYVVYSVDRKEHALRIDQDKCDSCGMCITLCPQNSLTLVERKDQSKVIFDGRNMPLPFLEILEEKLGPRFWEKNGAAGRS